MTERRKSRMRDRKKDDGGEKGKWGDNKQRERKRRRVNDGISIEEWKEHFVRLWRGSGEENSKRREKRESERGGRNGN